MAKPIMIQGTMSDVGKSVISAGLCRIFHQDGYKVAPFKSQNMARNSYITPDGLEIGRAQGMQAEAAKTRPRAEMNPILLKPTVEMGSQVILNGTYLDTLTAQEYFQRKLDFLPDIQRAYETLAAEHDIIVIEGAGSPVELNLIEHDIVNMGLATLLHAPTLVVGDIDRGGIFATLYGTIQLMKPEERKLVKGTLINKFKGNPDLLSPSFSKLEEITGVPLLGLVPMADVDLEGEDSLSDQISRGKTGKVLDFGVISLPHLVNFTDFHPLQRHGQVGVRYVSHPRELKELDALFLPGTSDPLSDSNWLKESGFEKEILKIASKGTLVLGLGGGAALLGEKMMTSSLTASGLGLLPYNTQIAGAKSQQIKGKIPVERGIFATLEEDTYTGYQTLEVSVVPTGTLDLFLEEHGKPDGGMTQSVVGWFSHGIFEHQQITQRLVESLLEQKGILHQEELLDYREYKEQQYDKLADLLREHLDMEAIYDIIFH